MPATATITMAMGLASFACTAASPISSAPITDTVWPIAEGRRNPASCSSSNEISSPSITSHGENGTSASARMNDCSSFAGIISRWYITAAT